MKKLLRVALVVGLMAGLLGGGVSEAAKKKKKKITREVTFEYVCPCVGRYQFGGATGTNLGGGVIAIGSKEKFLSATATDQSGMQVPVSINQDVDGDGFNDGVGTFCTETEDPMPINAGLELRVFVGDPTICGTPQVLLGGTIEFVFSNKP